jgi:tripartite-type tricarboxylate transporter receptor subunit TctC
MASVGNGTAQHVVGEWFKMMTGVNMVHVPYRGGAALLTDLLSARVEVYFPDAFGVYVEHVRTGKLRALAVVGPRRLEVLPDIPRIPLWHRGERLDRSRCAQEHARTQNKPAEDAV